MSLRTSPFVAAVGVAAALAWAPEPPGPHRAYVQRRRRAGTTPRDPQRRSRSAADDEAYRAAQDQHDHPTRRQAGRGRRAASSNPRI
jgi:hypothetical protein